MLDVRNLDGRDRLRTVVRGEVPGPPVMDALEDSLALDVTFRMVPKEVHDDARDGVWATPLGAALGGAIHARLPPGVRTTLQLDVTSVRPLRVGMGEGRAIGEGPSLSRQVEPVEVRPIDAQGHLFAHATTLCLIPRST